MKRRCVCWEGGESQGRVLESLMSWEGLRSPWSSIGTSGGVARRCLSSASDRGLRAGPAVPLMDGRKVGEGGSRRA